MYSSDHWKKNPQNSVNLYQCLTKCLRSSATKGNYWVQWVLMVLLVKVRQRGQHLAGI